MRCVESRGIRGSRFGSNRLGNWHRRENTVVDRRVRRLGPRRCTLGNGFGRCRCSWSWETRIRLTLRQRLSLRDGQTRYHCLSAHGTSYSWYIRDSRTEELLGDSGLVLVSQRTCGINRRRNADSWSAEDWSWVTERCCSRDVRVRELNRRRRERRRKGRSDGHRRKTRSRLNGLG